MNLLEKKTQTSRLKENLKEAREKNTYYIKGHNDMNVDGLPIRKNG